jgi:hypothetical protein
MAALPELQRGDLSFAESNNTTVVWHLLLMEDVADAELSVGDIIQGQYQPQNVNHTLGSTIAEAGGFSRANPLIQWVGGALETLTFEARLFSLHRNDQTARDKLETLKILRTPCQPMGRPPLTRFFWGDLIPGGMPCFVESIGGVQYDEIRSDGSIRGATLSISLKRFTPFTIERTTTSPVERTPTHVVRSGETYEMIAMRHWGDPMLGIPLRQQNPRYPMEKWAPKSLTDLSVGETIKLYPRRDLDQSKAKSLSHIFDTNNRSSADLRRYYFMKLAAKVAVIPKR